MKPFADGYRVKDVKRLCKMIRALVLLCLLALFLLVSSTAAVAEFGSGKVRFTPVLDLGFKYDDNIHLQEDSRKSSMVSELRSQMKVTVDNQINLTSIGYSGQYAIYHSSVSDSRLDHMFFGKVHHEVLRNLTFDFGGAYQMAHEQRGAFYIVGPESSLLEPDGFRVKQFNGLFVLGTGESKGRLEITGSQKYLNFISRKDVTANRNHESRGGGVTFIRNISPKTAFTLTGLYGTIDYVSETPGIEARSSIDQSYLLGVRWEVSRLSIGEAKLGLRRKTFISDLRANANGFDWSLAMNWTPLRMLEINIQSKGSFDESIGLSDYVDQKDLALAAEYTLSPKQSIHASVAGAMKRYPPTTVKDYVVTAVLSSGYKFSKWLTIGLAYNYVRQFSNRSGFDYGDSQINISFSVSI